jgi:hypothetical protein
MLVALILSTALAAAPQSTAAPPPVQPPITVTGQQPTSAEQKVCKWTGTGTMFPKRICMAPEDWAKAESNAEGDIQRMREIQHGARCSDFRC